MSNRNKLFGVKKLCRGVFAAASLVVGLGLWGTSGKAANPYLPMWEHIPDGEPYVFEDPEEPGTYRLYVYGSHDTRLTDYCGYDLVVWSAPLDDLTNWRYDGVIFESIVNGSADVLFAPDIAVVDNGDGSKTYYLYPNNQAGGRNGMVAVSDSPTGPFEVCNWKNQQQTQNDGVLGFDPAVFVDDDGRVYGYWGFQSSNMAELDPETMATVKSGCSILTETETGIDSCNDKDGLFRFFEASSMRKISMNGQSKYVFVYSRMSQQNEFGLGASNATLAYAYSDTPLGPWTYGGTLVDARARDVDENGKTIATYPGGNTHGSIVEVNGQWYVFYHRCINNDQYSRQGTAEPVTVEITDDGKVLISEAEVTSQGLEKNGLNPYNKVSAGIMCYRIGNSYVKATYDKEVDSSPVAGNKNGGIIGYKYFNFDLPGWQHLTGFDLDIQAKGVKGSIKLMLDSPWESRGGQHIGTVEIAAEDETSEIITKHVDLGLFDNITGKHALYMVFTGPAGKEIADIHAMVFAGDGIEPTPTPLPSPKPEPAVQIPVAGSSATPSLSSPTPETVPSLKKIAISGVKCKKGSIIITGKVSVSGSTVKIKVGNKAYKKAMLKGKKFTLKVSRLKKNTKVTIKISKSGYKNLLKVYKVK